MPTLSIGFENGIKRVAAVGMTYRVTFGGTWTPGEYYSMVFADSTGSYTLGEGRLYDLLTDSSNPPVACLTHDNKMYVVGGEYFMFSAIADPTGFEQQDIGAGTILLSDRSSQMVVARGLTWYQGKLAVFTETCIQIWSVDADPLNNKLEQTLPNIGSNYPLSIMSLGDLDVIFANSTGIHSLRARDSGLSAFVTDLGSPVNLVVRDLLHYPNKLELIQDTEVPTVCAVVEPHWNRFWLSIGLGTDYVIYVLSYFPTSGVIAWSTYISAFKIEKFCVYGNLVYARSGDTLFYYEDGVYTQVTATKIQIPFLDDKTPATMKVAKGIDTVMSGQWKLMASMDPSAASSGFETVFDSNTDSTVDLQRIGYAAQGTHFSLYAETSEPAAAKISGLIFHYELADAP